MPSFFLLYFLYLIFLFSSLSTILEFELFSLWPLRKISIPAKPKAGFFFPSSTNWVPQSFEVRGQNACEVQFTKKRRRTKAVIQFVSVHVIGLVLSQPNPDHECIGQSSIIPPCDEIQESPASSVTDNILSLEVKRNSI